MTEPVFCCDRLRLAWEYRYSVDALIEGPADLFTVESRYDEPAEHCPYCGKRLPEITASEKQTAPRTTSAA